MDPSRQHLDLNARDHHSAEAQLTDLNRRAVLRGLFYGLGAASLPAWIAMDAMAQTGGGEINIPLGPLGAQDFGPLELKTVLDDIPGVDHQLYAPAGFDVRVIMREGFNPVSKLREGVVGHIDPDGGAVFMHPSDGGWVYASNAEHTPGGVGATRFDAAGNIIDYYRICDNTRNNCAGGATPWNTWITCEEVSAGWCFECDPFGIEPQRRLDGLGARPGREAVAVDPINHAIYQTLDSGNQPFVRFVSNPDDLEILPDGVTRMRFESGVSQRLYIPAFGDLPAFNGSIPNNGTISAQLRAARPIEWVAENQTHTTFNGGEGIWYYEVPEALRTTPSAGSVPTRGVIIFATKNDGRVWAVDIENSLIELIVDGQNGQAFQSLTGNDANWSQVDNVVISPAGDSMVAEDGSRMRLAIVVNNQPSKLLMQITTGDSEITGPAFTADGSRLYFSRQGGRNVPGFSVRGTTYEMTIPPAFRAIQRADAFSFIERDTGAPGAVITSEAVVVSGFLGKLTVTIGLLNEAQFSIDGDAWSNVPRLIEAGQSLRVRHLSAATVGEAVETLVTIGSLAPSSKRSATFRTRTSDVDTRPDPFDFGTIEGAAPETLIESAVVVLTGFNMPTPIKCGPHCEYRIDGGEWTDADGELAPYQSLQMRHVSQKAPNAVRRTHLHVGEVPGHFATRTG